MEPDYTILGWGSYGAVIFPALPDISNYSRVKYKEDVTKIFYSKKDMENVYKRMKNTLQGILGEIEETQVYQYEYQYTVTDLPQSVRDELQKVKSGKEKDQSLLEYFKKTNHIYMLRMPYLGIDIVTKHFNSCDVEMIRNCPIYIIFSQIHKLIKQVNTLYESGYIHADIHYANITIQPITGDMSLIDYDYLDTCDKIYETYPFGEVYWNPPECLLFTRFNEFLNSDTPFSLNEEDDAYMDQKYLKSCIDYSMNTQLVRTTIAEKVNNEKQKTAEDEKIIRMSIKKTVTPIIKSSITSAINDNIQYIYELLSESNDENGIDEENIMKDFVLPTFDNYGLGTTLLEFVSYIYVGCNIDDLEEERMKEHLGKTIRKNSNPYSEEQLGVIAVTLKSMIELFHDMSSLYLRERPSPKDVMKTADKIIADFNEAYFK